MSRLRRLTLPSPKSATTMTILARQMGHVAAALRAARVCALARTKEEQCPARQLQRSDMSIAPDHGDGQAPEERHVGRCRTICAYDAPPELGPVAVRTWVKCNPDKPSLPQLP
jgi:hypothetical protein